MSLKSKIELLKRKCAGYDTNIFLTFIAGVLIQISTREENPLLKHLKSPQRQLFYLAFLNTRCSSKGIKNEPTQDEWDEMTILLDEIEMEYLFILTSSETKTEEDIKKTLISMSTYMNYHFNGPLSYQEQEIERIEKIFNLFKPILKKELDIIPSDLIKFYEIIDNQIDENLNKALTLYNPDNWKKFTQSCIDKGIDEPRDWIFEAPDEISRGINFMKNPGSFLVIDLNEIKYNSLSEEKFKKILELFTFQIEETDELVFYTEANGLMEKPFVKLSEDTYLPFFLKQFLNASFNFLFTFCSKHDERKTFRQRDRFLEDKVFELFSDFFREDGFIYANYSIDENRSEQDILVLYRQFALIIEVKASTNRAPMRNVDAAFKKIKSDFKKTIQNAYDQTNRVKNAFFENDVLLIKNNKKQVINKIQTSKYRENLYSIIVTYDRFGHIQSNLKELLIIDENDDYPWSVNLDDLEAFLLTIGKRRNKKQSLLTFLRHREKYHGHLLCTDELELCGLFLSSIKSFIHYSNFNKMLITTPDLTNPIEKAYSNGLGFKNERNYEVKKDKSMRYLYQKKY